MKSLTRNKLMTVFFMALSMVIFSCNSKEKKDAKARATTFISQNDVNKDGKVDMEEWKAAGEKMFENIEKNMSMQAERAKNSKMTDKIRAKMMANRPDPKINMERFLESRQMQFNNFDANKDGIIEFDEVFENFFEKLKQAAKRK